jgi:hypothetical protein
MNTYLDRIGRIGSETTDLVSVYGGTSFGSNPTVEQALELANLRWEVGIESLTTAQSRKRVKDNVLALVRLDNKEVLSTINSAKRPIQNRVCFAFLDTLREFEYGQIITAGELNGGRIVYMVMRLGSFEVVPGDVVEQHLLVANIHDVGMDFVIKLVPLRLASLTQLDFELHDLVVSDTSVPTNVPEADYVLSLAAANFGGVEKAFIHMANTRLSRQELDAVVYDILEVPESEPYAWEKGWLDRQPHWVGKKAIIDQLLIQGKGSDIPGTRGTLWAVYNAIASYADHYRSIRGVAGKPDLRFEVKLFGETAKLKLRAFEVCMRRSRCMVAA